MTCLDRFRDIFLVRHAKPSEVVKSTGNRDRVRITRTVWLSECVYTSDTIPRTPEISRLRFYEFLLNDLFVKD